MKSGFKKRKGILNPIVLSLFALSFLIGTSEFIVIGILPDIAKGLNISLTTAGYVVSVFAIIYALGTPFTSAYAGKKERHSFIVVCMLLFVLAHLLCAIAPNYFIFTIARIFIALVSGALLSVALTFPKDVLEENSVPQAIALIFTGFSVASVLGVPISTMLSSVIGWRMTFILIMIASFILTIILYRVLPKIQHQKAESLFGQFSLFLNKKIVFGVLGVMFSSGATYNFYTYLTPILQDKLHIEPKYTGLALSIFGIAALISNVLSGYLAKKYDMRDMLGIYFLQALFMGVMIFSFGSLIFGGIVILILGCLMYLMNSPSQIYFLNVASKENKGCESLASGLSPVFFNFGIATGSFSGSLIAKYIGFDYVGFGGMTFAILAMLSCICLRRVSKYSY